MLDTPQGAFYGSQVSAPVFKDTLQQILVAKGVQPSTHEGLPSFEEHGKDTKAAKVPVMEFLPDGKVKVPDFTGLDMRQTAELVQRGHLVLVPYGSGRAKSNRWRRVQSPRKVQSWKSGLNNILSLPEGKTEPRREFK